MFSTLFAQYVPLTVDFTIYDGIREGIPFVDGAIRKLARLCGGFAVTSENEVAAEQANEWLNNVRCFGICSGFDTFSYSFISSMLQYGRNAAEVVLSQSGREVYELVTPSPYKLRLITRDGETLLGEATSVGSVEPYARQDLFAFAALNVEKDNPHGTSLLRSLPFVVNISMVMQNAVRQRWMRQGAPAFLVKDQLPPDAVGVDAEAGVRVEQIKAQWNSAMQKRWNQEGIADFVMSTQGDFSVSPIESGAVLAFPEDLRVIEEQIVAAVELAPFMLGLQWSTTERLSQQQADMIVTFIDRVREEVAPVYMHILDWWARTSGVRAEFEPVWPEVSLQDRVETATAEKVEAEAKKVKTDTARIWWANGWTDQLGAGQMAGAEIEEPFVELPGPVYPDKSSAPAGEPLPGAEGAAKASWGKYPA